MSLPTNVGSGRIVGRYVVGVIDSPDDTDDEPELIPARGTITFTPSIGYVPNGTTEIPMTIMKAPITGVLDSEGYLCTPDNTVSLEGGLTRGVKLFATDVGQVTGWTYSVKYSFTPVGTVSPHIPDHTLTVPDKSVQDLTKVVPTPYAPVIGIPQMEAAVLRAEGVAQSVRDDADAGVFDGEKGDVGPMGPPVALEIGTVTASAGNPADDDIMSTLILSGTKTQAAIKAQIPIEQIGAQGPKGDPGGLMVGTALPVGVDLRTVTEPGLYRVTGSSVVNAPDNLSQQWFSMLVTKGDASTSSAMRVQQTIYPSGSEQGGLVMFQNNLTTGTGWSGWNAYTTTTIDHSVGVTVETWDYITRTKRLTYGRTGLRTIPLISNWGGTAQIQRFGDTVEMFIMDGDETNATSTHFVAIPSGFRPSGTNRIVGIAKTGTSLETCYSSGGNIRIARRAGVLETSLTWLTNDAWPTTLPGTPA